jgi:hypothetical protein
MFGFINFIGIKGIVTGIVCFGLGFGTGWLIGELVGKSLGKEIARVEQVENALEIKEKHEKIRNHRPDNDALVKRLLEGSF